MGTAVSYLFSLIVTAFALIVIVRRIRPGGRMPVTFTSLDEESTVYQVARCAAKELNIQRRDPQLRHSLGLYLYSANWNWMGSIPVAELALLRPFIDLMIAGKGPPQNLPAEYDDPRPETLRRFKQRMLTDRHAGIERCQKMFLRVGELVRPPKFTRLVDIDRELA